MPSIHRVPRHVRSTGVRPTGVRNFTISREEALEKLLAQREERAAQRKNRAAHHDIMHAPSDDSMDVERQDAAAAAAAADADAKLPSLLEEYYQLDQPEPPDLSDDIETVPGDTLMFPVSPAPPVVSEVQNYTIDPGLDEYMSGLEQELEDAAAAAAAAAEAAAAAASRSDKLVGGSSDTPTTDDTPVIDEHMAWLLNAIDAAAIQAPDDALTAARAGKRRAAPPKTLPAVHRLWEPEPEPAAAAAVAAAAAAAPPPAADQIAKTFSTFTQQLVSTAESKSTKSKDYREDVLCIQQFIIECKRFFNENDGGIREALGGKTSHPVFLAGVIKSKTSKNGDIIPEGPHAAPFLLALCTPDSELFNSDSLFDFCCVTVFTDHYPKTFDGPFDGPRYYGSERNVQQDARLSKREYQPSINLRFAGLYKFKDNLSRIDEWVDKLCKNNPETSSYNQRRALMGIANCLLYSIWNMYKKGIFAEEQGATAERLLGQYVHCRDIFRSQNEYGSSLKMSVHNRERSFDKATTAEDKAKIIENEKTHNLKVRFYV